MQFSSDYSFSIPHCESRVQKSCSVRQLDLISRVTLTARITNEVDLLLRMWFYWVAVRNQDAVYRLKLTTRLILQETFLDVIQWLGTFPWFLLNVSPFDTFKLCICIRNLSSTLWLFLRIHLALTLNFKCEYSELQGFTSMLLCVSELLWFVVWVQASAKSSDLNCLKTS